MRHKKYTKTDKYFVQADSFKQKYSGLKELRDVVCFAVYSEVEWHNNEHSMHVQWRIQIENVQEEGEC